MGRCTSLCFIIQYDGITPKTHPYQLAKLLKSQGVTVSCEPAARPCEGVKCFCAPAGAQKHFTPSQKRKFTLTVKLISYKVYYVFSIFENKEENYAWQRITWSMIYWPFIISFGAPHTPSIEGRLHRSSTGYCDSCAVKVR